MMPLLFAVQAVIVSFAPLFSKRLFGACQSADCRGHFGPWETHSNSGCYE